MVLALTALLALPGAALTAERQESDGVLHRMFDTAVDVFAAPADLSPEQAWSAVAVAGAAAALATTSADESLSRSISKPASRFGEDISKFGKALGEVPLNFGILGVFGLYGWWGDDADAKLTFESGLLGAACTEIVVEAIKVTAGRARPNSGLGSHHWRPFSGSASFPSGHTSFAFSLAGTINYFYPGWPGITALVVAGTTAYSRVHTLDHWPSDVLVGAFLGATISRAVAKRWDRKRRPDFEVVPTVDEHGGGAAVMSRF